MGVLPSAVSKWMSLEWRPDSNNCLRLSNVLGIDADFILELAGHAKRSRIPESTNARQLKSMIDYIDWYKPSRYTTVEGILRLYKEEDERDAEAPSTRLTQRSGSRVPAQ
jgi:transcriptional regulator with XRE-family HTH domain